MEWLNEYLKPELIWFLIGLLLLIAEFMIPGLIIAFFGVGAWITAIVCLLTTNLGINMQLGVFIVSSLLSLALLRRWVKGIFMGHVSGERDLRRELDEFIGERAVVTQKITPKLAGKVELHGTNWVAEADQEIPEGTAVEIIAKKNITFKVKAI
jgi:membrane protein implicated in regulation of membrane protease activity